MSEGRYVLWGFSWVNDVPVSRTLLPKTYRALRSWKLAAPEQTGTEMPWEAVGQVCRQLMGAGTVPVP